MTTEKSKSYVYLVVVVAALGYFVDIYDLILFGIVKNPSLLALGINNKASLFNKGNFLLSIQMAGMLFGGIVWGILAIKKEGYRFYFLLFCCIP